MKFSQIYESFVKSTSGNVYWGSQAAGLLVKCGDKFLLAKRASWVEEPGTWSFPGGKVDEGEDVKEAALREFMEETGYYGIVKDVRVLNVYRDGSFTYTTFIGYVDEEFKAELDDESSAYGWFEKDEFPKPLHFGLKGIMDKL